MSTLRITGTIPIINRILNDLSLIYVISNISDFKKDSKSKNYRIYCTITPRTVQNKNSVQNEYTLT